MTCHSAAGGSASTGTSSPDVTTVVERIADHHPGDLARSDAPPRRQEATGHLNRRRIDVGTEQVAPDHGRRFSDPLIHEESAGS